MHDEVAGKADSRIDLNRAGTPLLEIVSQPDMRSPLEAKAYLAELKLLLTYLGVSDCNMQEGSLRVDANINLHIDTPDGNVATPIVEIKNMNSFRAVERALAYEAERQYEVWQETGKQLGDVPKQTRGWDDVADVTRGQRHKEESSDYRYFPDPDLVPVTVSEAEVEASPSVAGRIAGRAAHAAGSDLRHHALRQRRAGEPRPAAGRLLSSSWPGSSATASWPATGCSRTCCARSTSGTSRSSSSRSRPAGLAELITRVQAGDLDTSRGREVFAEMLACGQSAAEVIAAKGIERVDESRADRAVPGTGRGQSQDRGRHQGGQAASRRQPDRPGQEAKPQRQSRPRARDLLGAGGEM